MVGYFYKTTTSANQVPKMKHSSGYANLQAAFDDLNSGDILVINSDYTLSSTVDVVNSTNALSGNILILGMGSVLKPNSNGSASPLLRIKNRTGTAIVTNITISGLRFDNDTVDEGSGNGTALEIYDDPNVSSGSVYHIRLEDLKITNFAKGIHLKNVFDIFIQHCLVEQSENGMNCETTNTSKKTGQIKMFGGFFLKNEKHILIDGVTNSEFDHLELFGFTCGHQRTGADGDSIGVDLNKNVAGIFTFGSHFEDLEYGIKLNSSSFLAASTVMGCKFIDIDDTGVDLSSGGANIMTTLGNVFRPNTAALLKAPTSPYLYQGFIACWRE